MATRMLPIACPGMDCQFHKPDVGETTHTPGSRGQLGWRPQGIHEDAQSAQSRKRPSPGPLRGKRSCQHSKQHADHAHDHVAHEQLFSALAAQWDPCTWFVGQPGWWPQGIHEDAQSAQSARSFKRPQPRSSSATGRLGLRLLQQGASNHGHSASAWACERSQEPAQPEWTAQFSTPGVLPGAFHLSYPAP